MNMLRLVIWLWYYDLWFIIMVVIYCEKWDYAWYTYVMVDIYIYKMCMSMECKKQIKNKIFCLFAEGLWPQPSAKIGSLPRAFAIALGKESYRKIPAYTLCRGPQGGPRQRIFFKKNLGIFFAEGLPVALGKDFFEKKSAQFLCRGPEVEALGKDSIPRNGAVMVNFLCRGSAKALPSARQTALDKGHLCRLKIPREPFAEGRAKPLPRASSPRQRGRVQ